MRIRPLYWSHDRDQFDLIDRLPEHVDLLTEIDKEQLLQKDGYQKLCWDYSVEVDAPSDRIVAQDKQVCEEVQRNLMAGVYPGGVFSPKHEQAVAWFQREVARAGQPAAAHRHEAPATS